MQTIAAPTTKNSLAKDSFWSLLTETMALPGLIVSAAILSRTLSLEAVGQFAIAMTFAQWLQFASITGLARIGIQVIAKEDDWKLAAGNVMSAFLISGAALTAIGILITPSVCSFLQCSELTPYMMLICLNVFLFSGQVGFRTVLAGLGRFKERSLITAVFWSSRIVLTAVLVLSGWQLWGAIFGFVGSTSIAFLFGCCLVRFGLRFDKSIFLKLCPGLPMLLGAVTMQFADKIDLFLIKGLGYSIADAGMFSVSKNAAAVAYFLGFSMAPVMVTAISRHLSANRPDAAVSLARQGMNLIMLTLPFGAVMATCGQELIGIVYGPSFSTASVYLGPLFLSALITTIMIVIFSSMTTFNCIRPTVFIALLMLGLNLVLQPLAIHHFGILGSAYAELIVTILALICSACVAWKQLRLAFSPSTLARVAFVFAVVWAVGTVWSTPLPVPALKTALVSLLVPVLYLLLREPLVLLGVRQAQQFLNHSKIGKALEGS